MQTCHEASRHISIASYDPPTSMHVVIRYLLVPISTPLLRVDDWLPVIVFIISVKDMTLHSTRPSAKPLTSQSLCACMKKRHTKALIQSNAKSGEGLSGYFLEVCTFLLMARLSELI